MDGEVHDPPQTSHHFRLLSTDTEDLIAATEGYDDVDDSANYGGYGHAAPYEEAEDDDVSEDISGGEHGDPVPVVPRDDRLNAINELMDLLDEGEQYLEVHCSDDDEHTDADLSPPHVDHHQFVDDAESRARSRSTPQPVYPPPQPSVSPPRRAAPGFESAEQVGQSCESSPEGVHGAPPAILHRSVTQWRPINSHYEGDDPAGHSPSRQVAHDARAAAVAAKQFLSGQQPDTGALINNYQSRTGSVPTERITLADVGANTPSSGTVKEPSALTSQASASTTGASTPTTTTHGTSPTDAHPLPQRTYRDVRERRRVKADGTSPARVFYSSYIVVGGGGTDGPTSAGVGDDPSRGNSGQLASKRSAAGVKRGSFGSAAYNMGAAHADTMAAAALKSAHHYGGGNVSGTGGPRRLQQVVHYWQRPQPQGSQAATGGFVFV